MYSTVSAYESKFILIRLLKLYSGHVPSYAAGILWKAKLAKKEGVENIESYTRALQGFLLFCHGSTVGAGTTLLTFVDLAARQVANTSINLLRGVIATKTGNWLT